MNFRTTIVLLILLLGVGAYVFFTQTPTENTGAQKTNPQKLLDITSSDVSKVVITPADGKRIVLERSTLPPATPTIGPAKSDWKMTEPVTGYADASKVSDLVDGVVSAMSTAQVIIGANAADYGLDNPQFTVDLDAGPKSARVFVGRQVKAGNELYVRVDGKDVAQVVGADLLDKIDTTPDKLRLTKLVNADGTVANWVSIQNGKDSVDIEKSGGLWQLSVPSTRPTAVPTTQPAEQSAVTDLLTAVGNAQAVAFGGDSDDANLLIGKPRATVTISDQRPTTQPAAASETIEFGSPDSLVGKNVWVRVTPPGVLVTIPKDTASSIIKTPLDLRNREVLKIDPANVSQIRIVKTRMATTQPIPLPAITQEVILKRRPPKKIDLMAGPVLPTTNAATQPTSQPAVASTQPSSTWQVVQGTTTSDADDTKVDAALAVFNPLRADKYLSTPPAPTAAGQNSFLVTITKSDGSTKDVYLSDPGESSSDPVNAVVGDSVFSLPRTAITAMNTDFAKTK